MKSKDTIRQTRSWALILVASVTMLLGISIVAIAILVRADLGWWSLLIGIGGLTSVTAAIMSIIKIDPSWILLDLILPG